MPYQVQRVCWQSCGWYVNNIAECVHLAPPGRWVIVSDRRAVLTTQIHSRQHLLGQRDSWVLSRYKQKQKHKYQKKGCWGKDILLSAIAVTAWPLSVRASWVVSMQRWILFTSGGPHCDIAASCADRQEKYKHRNTNTNTTRIANMIQKNLHIGNSHQKGISRHKAQKSRVFINWQKFQPTSVFIFFFSFWIIYLDKFFEEYVIFIFRKLELRSPKLEQHNLWGGGTNCVKGGSIKDPFST